MAGAAKSTSVLSANAYALHRGVTPPAVLKAIKTGRIAAAASRVGREWQIDVEIADRLWSRNTDQAMQREQPATAAAKAEQLAMFEASRPAPDAKSPPDAASGLTMIQARTVREGYQARLAQLDYKRRVGTLVLSDEVAREQYSLGRTLRDRLYQLPIQVAEQTAGMTDTREIANRMRDAIDEALSELTGSVQPNESAA